MTQDEIKFISRIEEQLSKVCAFYNENEKNVSKKYLMLFEEVRIFLMHDTKKLPSEFPISGAFSSVEAEEFQMKNKFILEESQELLKQK